VGNKKAKKGKNAQFVGQTKAVGQYSLHSRAILAYFDVPKKLVRPKKFFGPPNGTLSEIFLATWEGGGRSPKFICSTKFFGSSRAQSEKVGQISF
jgi:hypothetical protein